MVIYVYDILYCVRILIVFVILFILVDEFFYLEDLGFSDLRLESEISNRSRIKI